MPQVHLPLFPEGTTLINSHLAFETRDQTITYFYGNHPVFSHKKDDLATFRMITSQYIATGSARTCEIIKSFGVPSATVKRYVRLYREDGAAGFYKERNRRGAAVLTLEVLEKAQRFLDEGKSRSQTAEALGIKSNTLSKAIQAGKLYEVTKKILHYHPQH